MDAASDLFFFGFPAIFRVIGYVSDSSYAILSIISISTGQLLGDF